MDAQSEFYDALETRSAEQREGALFAALPEQIAHAQAGAPAYTRVLAGVNAEEICNRKALAELPVTRKSELIELQTAEPPFGGFAALGPAPLVRVFASPGPIYGPESNRQDYWRMARALYAAGFRRGDLIHNSFAYHFTPAGSMLESGAHAIGCAVFAAGIGQTELQVGAIAGLRPRGYVGTPSFLKVLLEKGKETKADLSSMDKALVSAEALPPSLRNEIGEHGVAVLQCYATADLGLIAYESSAQEGLIMDEAVILEIVRPGTGDPVSDGQVGEVVVSTLNPDYPLIRFATGDLSAVMEGPSPCGRTNVRIKGWMGRADQTTKVKGMFVHPSQVASVLERHPDVVAGRLVVESRDNYDIMTLHCEVGGESNTDLPQRIAGTIQDVCKLRGEVKIVSPGSLANDGKVIDDRRTYE